MRHGFSCSPIHIDLLPDRSGMSSPFNTVMTVDLAARFSAVCIMTRDGRIIHEFDSWGKAWYEFVKEIVTAARHHKIDLLVLEDIPYGLSKQFMIKPPLRLQGAMIQALQAAPGNLLNKTVFLNPATWQRHFEGVYRGKEKGALVAAQRFDYEPPDMLTLHAADVPATGKERAKIRAQLKKACGDYVDAFLMARYAFEYTSRGEMLEKSGIQEPKI